MDLSSLLEQVHFLNFLSSKATQYNARCLSIRNAIAEILNSFWGWLWVRVPLTIGVPAVEHSIKKINLP